MVDEPPFLKFPKGGVGPELEASTFQNTTTRVPHPTTEAQDSAPWGSGTHHLLSPATAPNQEVSIPVVFFFPSVDHPDYLEREKNKKGSFFS